MKAITELLEKQHQLKTEVGNLSNGHARVGMRTNTIEIDTTGMSEANARDLFHLAEDHTAGFIRTTLEHKESELSEVNGVLDRVEKLLGDNL